MDIFSILGLAAFALIAALHVSAQMTRWRRLRARRWKPIATAPRDGSVILLAFGRDSVRMGQWDSVADRWPWKFYDQHKSNFDPIINGTTDGSGGPSHWRPVPAGPFKQ